MGVKVSFLPGCNPLEHQVILDVFALARGAGCKAYLVGGYVRDSLNVNSVQPRPRLSSKNLRDFDFAVVDSSGLKASPAVALAEMAAEKLGGHFVLLDSLNDIGRVVLDEPVLTYLDFAGVTGSIEADIHRRDFTVNAMVFDEEHADEILDPTGGLADLKNRVIRAVSQQVLQDDPLRILRAYRFAACLGAQIDGPTKEYLRKHVHLLQQVARERITYEFFTMMDCPDVAKLVVEMGEIGLLEEIYPELKECRKVTANSFHHLALFDHSVETIPQLEERWLSLPAWVRQSADQELSGGISRRAATKVAALLHDIGKPGTWEITPEGRHTFIGHDKLGAEMVRPLAEREKWSKTLTRFVERLVLWHLRPGHLFHTGTPTAKALNRFYRTVGEEVPELMMLAFADFGATCGPGLTGVDRERLERCMVELLDGYPAYIEASKRLPKLLSGQDVMRILGIKPGPIIGQILGSLTEAQEINEVTDLAQAEAFVLNCKAIEN